jgi:hypothetical protein
MEKEIRRLFRKTNFSSLFRDKQNNKARPPREGKEE